MQAHWRESWPAKGELRGLTRKYAADIDGVLAWSREARDRLAQLDVSEEALAGLQRRVDELAAQLVDAAAAITKARTKAAKVVGQAGHRRAGRTGDGGRGVQHLGDRPCWRAPTTPRR